MFSRKRRGWVPLHQPRSSEPKRAEDKLSGSVHLSKVDTCSYLINFLRRPVAGLVRLVLHIVAASEWYWGLRSQVCACTNTVNLFPIFGISLFGSEELLMCGRCPGFLLCLCDEE